MWMFLVTFRLTPWCGCWSQNYSAFCMGRTTLWKGFNLFLGIAFKGTPNLGWNFISDYAPRFGSSAPMVIVLFILAQASNRKSNPILTSQAGGLFFPNQGCNPKKKGNSWIQVCLGRDIGSACKFLLMGPGVMSVSCLCFLKTASPGLQAGRVGTK